MKQWRGERFRRGAVLCLLTFSATSPLPSQEIRISDFRLPETTFSRLTAALNGSVNDSHVEGWTGEGGDTDDRVTAAFSYLRYETSERTTLDLRPTFSIDHQFSSQQTHDSANVSASEYQEQSARIDFPFHMARYFQPETWYWYASGQARAFLRTAQLDEEIRRDGHYELDHYGYDVRAEAGVGYGIIRDGQSIFAVLRILDRLRDEGLLLREPEHGEIVSLAQAYSQRVRFTSLFDRPEKHFFGDVFDRLVRAGAVDSAALTPRAVLHVADVRLESIIRRMFGWRIQAGVRHLSSQESFTSTLSRVRERSSYDMATVLLEWGMDIDISAHVRSVLAADHVISPNFPSITSVNWRTSLSYELTERIESVLQHSFVRSERIEYLPDFAARLLTISHGVNGTFLYYLEDRMIFRFEMGFGSDHTSFRGSVRRNRLSASFGLTYRIF